MFQGRAASLKFCDVLPGNSTTTRPASPAAIVGKLTSWTPGGAIMIGVDQVAPWSFETERNGRRKDPSCHTAYTLSAESTASVTSWSAIGVLFVIFTRVQLLPASPLTATHGSPQWPFGRKIRPVPSASR